MARLSRRDVPDVAIVVVGAIAVGGLLLAYVKGWGAEAFLVIPNSLVIVVYIVAMAAGVRLLDGTARLVAVLATPAFLDQCQTDRACLAYKGLAGVVAPQSALAPSPSAA
jgi:L-asparagine transporter-like permease